MVRGLDQSDRPWDNGWGDPQLDTDMEELHPYLYSRSMYSFRGKELPPLPAIDTFSHTNPDSLLFGKDNHSAIVNEYAWLWVRRDGEPTELTEQGYAKYYSGLNATERFELYARSCAIQTEYYRALRPAGVMQFAGLNSNYEGCKTTDIFIDVETLEIEANIEKYVKDAFAPVGLCIWHWDDVVKKGIKKSIQIVLINDLPGSWEGEVELSIVSGDIAILSNTTSPIYIDSSGKIVIETVIEFPEKLGEYELIASITGANDKEVRSVRKFEICE
jgi:beta-galactosidase